MEANPLYVNKPINLFGYTPVWIEGKNPRGYIPQSPRYFPLWEMRIFRQREMCSMSPATFSLLLSHTGKENSHPWCCSPPPSQVLPTVPTHWFSLHYSLTRLVRKFPTTLAPFSLSLSPTLLGVRFNISWEKRSGQKRAFAFCHMSAANSSYHTRSHFCKLIFKSKSHRNLAGTGESPCPRQ